MKKLLFYSILLLVRPDKEDYGPQSPSMEPTLKQCQTLSADMAPYELASSQLREVVVQEARPHVRWASRFPWSSLMTLALSGTSDATFNLVTYPSNAIMASSPIAAGFGVSCGGGFNITLQKNGIRDIAVESSDCDYLRDRANRNKASGAWARAYDTLRIFIERCANEDNTWQEINSLAGVIASLATQTENPQLYLVHREWLKSVMYLNTTDPWYYCAVANGILGTFGSDGNGAVAVLDYLIESKRCEGFAFWGEDRLKIREDQVQLWQDTVTNPEATPLDTSKKTLEDLDLQILRGQNSVASGEGVNGSIVKMFVNENPFRESNEATIELSKPVLARLSLHDAMGKLVWGSNDLIRLPEGKSSYPLEINHLASGTYYLRLATSQGEVRTIKLTKVN